IDVGGIDDLVCLVFDLVGLYLFCISHKGRYSPDVEDFVYAKLSRIACTKPLCLGVRCRSASIIEAIARAAVCTSSLTTRYLKRSKKRTSSREFFSRSSRS